VIGSKNGKKYYFPWCGTVKMIKPENQIKFSSIEEARKAGYLPAVNCKGLK
jgi:methylphosphotriester-DNA--protein-cysteine methyltransferase